MRGALVLVLVAAPYSVNAAPRRTPNAAGSTPSTVTVGGSGSATAGTGSAGTPHSEGQYGGVTPGEPAAATHDVKPKHLPAKGTLTWIGFEAKDGGAQVFFQSVAPFALSQRVEAGSLIVHLDLPRLGHNTWRQVDTRFFDNPLSGIVARAVSAVRATKAHPARAAGIEAKIAFKNAKDAKEAVVRTATEADGMYYAYLTFGEGTETTGPGDSLPEDVEKPAAKPEPAQEPAEAPPPAPSKPAKSQKQETDTDQPPDLPKSK
jgi:hypothetical protein